MQGKLFTVTENPDDRSQSRKKKAGQWTEAAKKIRKDGSSRYCMATLEQQKVHFARELSSKSKKEIGLDCTTSGVNLYNFRNLKPTLFA